MHLYMFVSFPVIFLLLLITMSKKSLKRPHNDRYSGNLIFSFGISEGLRISNIKHITFKSIVSKKTIKFKIHQIYWKKSTEQ